MDEEMMFSLSYEQLTRIAEARKASTLLGFWYELAITGAPVKNYEQTKALIDADQQRLRKLIWPEADKQ